MQSKRYNPVNSLSRAPNFFQFLALSIVLSLLVVFFTSVQSNMINQTNRISLTIIFALAFASLLVSVMVCCSTDPVDHIVPIYLSPDRSTVLKSLANCLYCESCESYVMQTSRHCKVCGRCVEHFDHHCIWINNCIGSQNYRSFFLMITSLALYLTVFIASVCTLWSEQRWTSFTLHMAVNWFFLVPAIISLLPVSILIALHCFLISKGLTTYEYIMGKKEKESRAQLQINAHNRTDNALANNNRVGVQVDEVIFQPQADLQTLEQYGSSEHSEQPSKSIDSKANPPEESEVAEKAAGTMPVVSKVTRDVSLKEFYANHKSLKLLVGNSIQVEAVLPQRRHVSHKRSMPHARVIMIEQHKQAK